MSKPDSEVPLTSTWLRAHITQGVNSVGGCKLADRQTWTSAGQERSSPIKPLHRAKCKCVMAPAMAGDRMEVLHRESSRSDLPCLRQPHVAAVSRDLSAPLLAARLKKAAVTPNAAKKSAFGGAVDPRNEGTMPKSLAELGDFGRPHAESAEQRAKAAANFQGRA